MPRRVAEMRRSFFCSGKSLDSAASEKPQDYHTHTRAYVQAHVSAPMRLRRHAHLNIKIPIFPIKIPIKTNFRSQTTPAKNNRPFQKTSDVFHIFLYFAIYAITPCEPDTRTKYENKTHKQQCSRQKTTYRRRKNYSRERLFFSIVSTHSSRRYKSSGEK